MKPMLNHLKMRFRLLYLNPVYYFISLLYCIPLFVGYWFEIHQDLDSSILVAPLRWTLVIAFACIILAGQTVSGKLVQLNKAAMPSLPAGKIARNSAEVVFIVILLLAARIIQMFFLDSLDIGIFILDTIKGILLFIPIIAVFIPRDRGDHILTLIDATLVLSALFLWAGAGFFSSLPACFLFCLLLTPVPFIIERSENIFSNLISLSSPASMALQRPAENPTIRFKKDLYLRSLILNWKWLVLIGAVEILSVYLTYAGFINSILLMVITGFAYYIAFRLLFSPAGISHLVSDSGQKSAFYNSFDGSYLTTWSILPIHPKTILFGVFSFVLTISGIFWLATLLTWLIAEWPVSPLAWIPFAIAIPCGAGLITLSAGGHKHATVFTAVIFIADLVLGMGIVSSELTLLTISGLILLFILGLAPVTPVLWKSMKI